MNSREEQSDTFLLSDALDDEFFTEIIENKLKIGRDEFKLRLVVITPATGKNENFVCVVYRAKIKIQLLETDENVSVDVIIKALLSTLKELKEFGVFPRERFMYENILKSLEGIYFEATGSEIQFGPRSLKFSNEPYEIIVMEDLKAMGYVSLDRKIGANFEQAKVFLSKLAKFHATSAIRYRKEGVINPTYLDRNASMPTLDESHPLVKAFARQHKAFSDSIRTYDDCDAYAEKISNWKASNIFSIFVNAAAPMRCGFTVLGHGDAWINNMMFKSDDVIMYDFQGSVWASPSRDLLYFLISSVSDDVIVKHFDDLIEYYHQELCKSLKDVAYDHYIPTLSELFIDIMEKGHFAAMCLMNILCVVKNEFSEEINIETVMGKSNDAEAKKYYSQIYGNETYRKSMRKWLPFLNEKGFFETLLVSF